MLGGITGHKDLARDTGVIVRPDEAIEVADAIVRVFIDDGDRTNRAKARLKYVLDAWGFDKFLSLVEEKLGTQLAARARRRDRAAPDAGPAWRISACIRRNKQALNLDRRRACLSDD